MSLNERARILVVDDESQIRRFLRTSLTAHGFQVFEAATAQAALEQTIVIKPDVIILDLGLPDRDGLAVLRELREWSKIPVIVLSVREREQDKIAALDAGADDYLTKPFGMGELFARIRATLRHMAEPLDEPVFQTGELKVDFARRLVTLAQREIKLTPTEYSILKHLVTYAGKVVTHRQLLRAVWGVQYENESQYLRVHVGNLRRKIENDTARPKYLLTEPGVGYRLRTDEMN
ncbi:MAG: response regulator [Chloroflexi bacterium]|nr:response regulator [Chloroflexota bacterium]